MSHGPGALSPTTNSPPAPRTAPAPNDPRAAELICPPPSFETSTTPPSESASAEPRPINLRAWFVVFLLWMGGLTLGAKWGLNVGAGGAPLGLATWLLCLYAFYLSLCCVFFPLPTSGAVLLMASDVAAAEVGIHGFGWARLLVVATVGAFATGMANLNEYHLFTYLLRIRRLGAVRETRLYRAAARWFETNPFLVIFAFSFIPIPVDVIRWLAIIDRYPRVRFFLAYFLGRWIRYALWCLTAMALALRPWHIIAIQALLVVAALMKMIPGFVANARASRSTLDQTSAGPEVRPVRIRADH